MDLDLIGVESFLTVVDERHFGRAAKRVKVTSSGLTKRIQRLERQVGVELLHRGPGGTAGPTAAGARFAEHARLLLDYAECARSIARGESPRHRVTVALAGSPHEWPPAIRGLCRRVVAEMRASHPDIGVRFRGVPFATLSASLSTETADLTLSAAAAAGASSVPLAPLTRVGVVSTRHPYAEAASVDVREFADLTLIHNPDLPREWMDPWILGDVRGRKDARLTAIPADDFAAIRTGLASGRAATVGYAGYSAALPASLRAIELRGAPVSHWHAAFRCRDRNTEPTRALVATLSRQLTSPR